MPTEPHEHDYVTACFDCGHMITDAELQKENTALRDQLAQVGSVSAESAAKEIAERFIGSGENIQMRRERCAEAILTAIIRATRGQP